MTTERSRRPNDHRNKHIWFVFEFVRERQKQTRLCGKMDRTFGACRCGCAATKIGQFHLINRAGCVFVCARLVDSYANGWRKRQRWRRASCFFFAQNDLCLVRHRSSAVGFG